MKHIGLLLVISFITALQAVPVAAKSTINIVTVAGPDWHGEIEITDPEVLASLYPGMFLVYDHAVSPPADLDRGYLIARGYVDEAERFWFDRLLYFPGSPGYAYYLEVVDGSGPMDGNWYEVTDSGADALRTGLTAKGARLPDAGSAHDEGKSAVSNQGDQAVESVAKAQRQSADEFLTTGPIELLSRAATVPDGIGIRLVGVGTVGLLAVFLGGVAGWTLHARRASLRTIEH